MTAFSIVTVLHDSQAHLERLLASLELLPQRPQVICVDSGSSDRGPELAEEWGAEVLILEGNPGFGAGNNAGLALAAHPVTVLLNPDCIALDDGLARLATLAAPSDALIVPRLLNPDGSVQRSAHQLPGGPGGLLAAVIPPRLLPRPLRERLEPFRARSPRPVGWAIAACVAARTSLLRRLGPFDPYAFLFYEDLELCLRARAQGATTILHPEIALTHVGSHSTVPSLGPTMLELEALRRREVVERWLGEDALALDDLSQSLAFRLRAIAGRDRERNLAMAAALRRARRGI